MHIQLLLTKVKLLVDKQVKHVVAALHVAQTDIQLEHSKTPLS
jgi:hypothetical protein